MRSDVLLRRLPLSFEPNQGQFSGDTRFRIRAASNALSLTSDGWKMGPHHGISVAFQDIRKHVRIVGETRLPGTVNYFLGNVPSRWHVDIPTYRRVTYRDLYPGIDLTYQGSGSVVEAMWTLAPFAQLGRVRMIMHGTSRLQVQHDGTLTSGVRDSRFMMSAPQAYQSIDGTRRYAPIRFQLDAPDRVSLRVGAYDHNRPLVIDPTLTFATTLGGSSSDFASGIAVDVAGNSYVTGSTSSPDFPVKGAVQPREPGTTDQEDAFVTKINPAGTALIFSTYLGGSNDEDGAAIAVGPSGATYITGFTRSTNFPQRLGVSQQSGGCNSRGSTGDAFVVKLSPRGNKLIYSTCLGGSGTDWGTAIAVDRTGAAVVTGSTGSNNFPIVHPFQSHRAGSLDGFVAKVAPGGRKLLASSYLGGTGADESSGVALDRTGAPYVVGSTNSLDFPRRSTLQPHLAGNTDAFVAKLDPSCHHIRYATYLGGAGADTGLSVAVDPRGDAYVAGATQSSNFPTTHALQAQFGGGTDAFVAELAPDGASLVFSNYLGGSENDVATAIAVDSAGQVYLTGSTSSPDFPVRHPLQAAYAGGFFYGDAFATELAPGGQSLVSSTFLGGAGDDVGTAIAVGASGDAYITGGTSSQDFPVTTEVTGSRPSRGNAFVVRLHDDPTTPLPAFAIRPR